MNIPTNNIYQSGQIIRHNPYKNKTARADSSVTDVPTDIHQDKLNNIKLSIKMKTYHINIKTLSDVLLKNI